MTVRNSLLVTLYLSCWELSLSDIIRSFPSCAWDNTLPIPTYEASVSNRYFSPGFGYANIGAEHNLYLSSSNAL